jgi:PIN domain nuclease of toxin-antitoxin system
MRLLLDTHILIWLLAQTIAENLSLISADSMFDTYAISRYG